MFESELRTIEESFRFQSMLEHNPSIREEFKTDPRKVLLVYHAFKVGCAEAILENPLIIGGFVKKVLALGEDSVEAYVTEARKMWGGR